MDRLFDYFSKETQQKIFEAFERSPGNELDEKFDSPESSAALAANTFGFFIEQAERLPLIPGTIAFGRRAKGVWVEECVRFPWAGGLHPWLDALIETETHLIGVESKRYEPFRSKPKAEFSDAYWRAVWGENMRPYEALRDQLRDNFVRFDHLNAAQLIKHALGLRTQAKKRGKSVALVYLYAEPEVWPDGRPIGAQVRERHAVEVELFARLVSGAEVAFRSCTYNELLAAFRQSGDSELSKHADMIAQRFNPDGPAYPPPSLISHSRSSVLRTFP